MTSQKGRMFTFAGKRMKVWNLFTGCSFRCSYCWARRLAETRLKASYPNGFIPTTHPDRFNRRFKPDDFVFPVSMGDIIFAPPPVWRVIIQAVYDYPNTKFLLCTKEPRVFGKLPDTDNLYLGTTLETNRQYIYGAPAPYIRALAMKNLNHAKKFISIEPIMDFDKEFLKWIEDIKPEIIEIGADNYRNGLPEPDPDKVNTLLKFLRDICPTVIEKHGLERLK